MDRWEGEMARSYRSTTLQQRREIDDRAHRGETDRQIGAALQLSRETVRKWRRRAHQHGRTALAPRLGRPATGVLGHFPPEIGQVIRELRQAHPGWGSVTLRLEAAKDVRWLGQALPSRARVAAFLKAEKLVRPYARHRPLLQPAPSPLTAPHMEWEMDAQGVRQVTGVGQVSVINIGDPYSHVRVGSQAYVGKTKNDTADYQLALRRAFLRYGLPAGLSLDHDTAFFDNTSAAPYPSRLHLWALALNIAVRFIDVARPTQHGFIERTHQVVERQGAGPLSGTTPAALQLTLDQRLEFLNDTYPCRTLGGQAPLHAFPTATHSGRPYRLELESDLLDLPRVYVYLAQHRWLRQVSDKGQFFLGAYRYGLGQAWALQTVDIQFEPEEVTWHCQSADGQWTACLPAKGLTKAALMGELQMDRFAGYQYGFPWTREICRSNVLHREAASTTL
jgi:hypothetical protein